MPAIIGPASSHACPIGTATQVSMCAQQHLQLQVCVASGEIIPPDEKQVLRCKVCKHSMLLREIRGYLACPLCHAPLPMASDMGVVRPRPY